MKRAELAEYIEARIQALKITKTAFAKRAGISRSELYKILCQDVGHIRLSTLMSLARALDINVLNLVHHLVAAHHVDGQAVCRHQINGDVFGIVRPMLSLDCLAVTVNEEFEHTWEICNLGSAIWEGRRLVCLNGNVITLRGRTRSSLPLLQSDLMPVVREIPIPNCAPGSSVHVGVTLRAPAFACTTTSYWKMVDESGTYCYPGLEEVFCKVHVVGR